MSFFNEDDFAALERNVSAVQRFKLNRIAYNKIFEADSDHKPIDFIQLVHRALFNDFISNAINVLDTTPKVRSFLYFQKLKKDDVSNFVEIKNLNWDLLLEYRDKLMLIRNKTHFHFSHQYVDDYKAVWDEAKLKIDELDEVMDIVWNVLSFLNSRHTGKNIKLPDYDGEDAKAATQFVSNFNVPSRSKVLS